jgi:hypothetical protein
VKELPASLRALGRSEPPDTIHVSGRTYRLARCFKHDFFACTSLYHGKSGRIVLKLGRRADICGLPAEWMGRLLARHEADCYRAVADLDAVPRFIGRWGATGIVHEYVEGRHLSKGVELPDDFFDRLELAVAAIHARDMAYVDLEKRQNVLLGDDGRPYLVDFQISWRLPARWGGRTPPARWLCQKLQEGDRYHLLKLRRRFRRDQLSEEQIRASYRKPFWVRLHAHLTAPLLKLRRHTLNRLDPSRKVGERGAAPDGRNVDGPPIDDEVNQPSSPETSGPLT